MTGRIVFPDKFPDDQRTVILRIHLRNQIVAILVKTLEFARVHMEMISFFVAVVFQTRRNIFHETETFIGRRRIFRRLVSPAIDRMAASVARIPQLQGVKPEKSRNAVRRPHVQLPAELFLRGIGQAEMSRKEQRLPDGKIILLARFHKLLQIVEIVSSPC